MDDDQAKLEAEVEDIEREAQELGYAIVGAEYEKLLTVAQRLPSGDLAEAHTLLAAEAAGVVKFT